MSIRNDIERTILDLVAGANWDDLIPRLQAYTCNYLQSSGGHADPRQKIVDAYVVQAVQVAIERGADYAPWKRWKTLFELLCAIVAHLIDQYEQTVDAIVRQAPWPDLTARLIALTVKRCGGRTSRHGRSAEDYVYEAIQALIARRRYFPYDRVTLFAFLYGTIRSLYAHEAEKMAAEGAHLTIVRKSFEAVLPSEWNEDRLVAPSGHDNRAALFLARDFLLTIEDPALRRYAEMRALGGCDTAAEYAELLGVSQNVIRNWDRQLRRRRNRWDPAR